MIPSPAMRTLAAGGAAGLLSAAALAWRGRRDAHSAVAPLNATSHIVWGEEALHADRPTLRHTLTGSLLHAGSALMWGLLFDRLLHRLRPRGRRRPWCAVRSRPRPPRRWSTCCCCRGG